MSHVDRRSFFMPHRRPEKRLPKLRPELIETENPERFAALRTARAAAPPLSGLNPYMGPWTNTEVIHLLRRTMFGVTKADVTYFANGTMEQAVDELLNSAYTPPAPPVNDYNNTDYTDPNVPSGEIWIDADLLTDGGEGYRIESLRGWWLRQMLKNERSIREKMTLFWYNHVPILFNDVFSGGHLYRYLDTIRSNSLGNFKSMMKDITLDPAMLYFLSGYINSNTAPDENYAREIQELFVIGKDLPQYFTEDDVKAAARLLTGWRIGPLFTHYFNQNQHDSGDKQFSAFYNNKKILGQSGAAGGEAELDEFLDMLFGHPEAARYICRQIYHFFVYHGIDANTETNVIEPLAQIFRDNNYDIIPVMNALLKSEHFFDVLNQGAVIKSPVDMTTCFFSQLGVTLPGDADLLDTFYISYATNQYMFQQLQVPGDPPNVAGWQAYYQEPALDKIWINGSTLPKRGQFTEIMIFVGFYGINTHVIADVLGFAASLDNPSDPTALVNEIHELLLGLPVSPIIKTYHKAILLTNLPSEYYWTLAWDAYVANPTDPIIKGEVENRLKYLLHVITQMEEHQLM